MTEKEIVAQIKATKAPLDGQKFVIKTNKGNLTITKEEINSTIGAYIVIHKGSWIGRYSYGQSNSHYSNPAKAWDGLKSDLIKRVYYFL